MTIVKVIEDDVCYYAFHISISQYEYKSLVLKKIEFNCNEKKNYTIYVTFIHIIMYFNLIKKKNTPLNKLYLNFIFLKKISNIWVGFIAFTTRKGH